MNKNSSDTKQTDRGWKQQEGQKFISDHDIMGHKDWLKQGTRFQRKSQQGKAGAPTFISDDDIVQKRVA